MSKEIERKFLIKKVPDINNFKSVLYERYYIYRDDVIELRIQKKGEKYEIERKKIINGLKAIKTKISISKSEFEKLKKLGAKVIIKESYFFDNNPSMSIKIYHGQHKGLNKVEVEFDSEKSAKNFSIPDWFGEEITDSIVSRDAKLLDLSHEELQNFLNK